MKSERIEWVDIAKGIGIILVTIGHTRLSGTVIGMWLTQFHMPLFFVMAGLCFDEFRYATYGEYVKRKVVALGYPYLMLSIVAAAVYSVLCFNPEITVVGLAIDTMKGWSVGPLWFVSALFFVELIFGALCKVCKNGGGRAVCVVMLSCIGYKIYREHDPRVWWELPTTLYSVLFYWTGWATRPFVGRIASSRWVSIGAVIFGMLSLATVWIHPHVYGLAGMNIVNPFWFAGIGIVGTAFIALVSIWIEKWNFAKRILVWFGKNSLILLAMHCVCGVCATSWGLNGAVIFVLEYAMFAGLTWLIAEKAPWMVRLK